MKFIFFSPVNFQRGDWRSSVETGIGGSETSHVEMAWRLANRGHEVINYVPLPTGCPPEWRNTVWKDITEVDYSQNGVWVLYRCPETLDHFTLDHPNKTMWLVHQDWEYPTLIGDRLKKLDKLLILCQWHKEYMIARHPESLDSKILLTSNGIKTDLIREIEAEGRLFRDPKKIMYASSPDRGLVGLLKMFTRAREFDDELELHAFYGFDNIDKLSDAPQFRYFKQIKKDVLSYEGKPGVYLHGRVTQPELYRHWLTSGLWGYPTNFCETSCITCMEAQAMGAIPLTNAVAALKQNVHWGIFIHGDAYGDPLAHARYAAEMLRWTGDPMLQESIRPQMMADARQRFDWEVFVDQWEREAEASYALR